MKVFLISTFILFIIGLVVYVLSAATILLYLYFLIAAFYEVLQFYRFYQFQKINFNAPQNISANLSLALSMKNKKGFKKVTNYLAIVLLVTAISLTWPVDILKAFSSKNHANRMSYLSTFVTNPLQIDMIIYNFIVSIVLLIFYYYHLLRIEYIKVFLIGSVLSVNFLLLYFIISDNTIAKLFRKTTKSIIQQVVVFCLIATIELLIFLLLLIGIYKSHGLNEESVKFVMNEFFKQKSINQIWLNYNHLDVLTLLVNLSGLIFAATIIDTLKNFRSFTRDKDDLKSIAYGMLYQRHYNDALYWLDKESKVNWDNTFWDYNAIALIGLNQISKAIESIGRIHIYEEESDYISDHKFYTVCSMLKTFVVDDENISRFALRWIENCQCDGYYFLFLTTFYFSSPEASLFHKILDLFSKQEFLKDKLPLTYNLVNGIENNLSYYEAISQPFEENKYERFDTFTKSILEIMLLTSKAGQEADNDSIFNDLEKLELMVSGITKSKELSVLVLCLNGVLMALREYNSGLFEPLLYFYNNQKRRITNPEDMKVVEQFNNIISK